MFKIVNTYILYIFLPIAILLLVLFIYGEYKRNIQWKKFGDIKLLETLMPARSLFRQRLKFALQWMALLALILVASRIQYSFGGGGIGKRLNVELVAVVDVSNSMLCDDETPTRLDKAKRVLSAFLENSDNAKFGLVEFAGVPVTKMPLTSDFTSSKMFINSLDPADVSTQGTAIGAALRQAQKCFSKEESVARSILLITDAENHEDDAVATAQDIVKNSKIQINVIGVGTSRGALLKLGDTTLIDTNGQPVVTKLNEQAAKAIADVADGIYVQGGSPAEMISAVNDQIKKVAEGTADSKINAVFSDQFETFAWIAFILLMLNCIIMERKNHLLQKLDFSKFSLSKKK